MHLSNRNKIGVHKPFALVYARYNDKYYICSWKGRFEYIPRHDHQLLPFSSIFYFEKIIEEYFMI